MSIRKPANPQCPVCHGQGFVHREDGILRQQHRRCPHCRPSMPHSRKNVLPDASNQLSWYDSLELLNQHVFRGPFNHILPGEVELAHKMGGGMRYRDYVIRPHRGGYFTVVYEKNAFMNRILRK